MKTLDNFIIINRKKRLHSMNYEKIHITDTQVIDILTQIVSENPNFIYQPRPKQNNPKVRSCTYVYNNQPDCLIGHVFYRLGVPIEILKQQEGNTVDEIMPNLLTGMSGGLINLLNYVQQLQDFTKTSWNNVLNNTHVQMLINYTRI